MATGFQVSLLLALFPASLLAEEVARSGPASAPATAAAPPAAPAVAPGKGAETATPRMGVIFGGAFEGFEVVGPLEGAKTTRLAAHYEWDFGVRPFTRKTWEEKGLDWEQFLPRARELADGIADRIESRLVRDHRGVALYAIVADEDPFLTSVILSPKFHERFREILGDRLHVVLLERNRFYVFPATGGALADFTPALLEEYRGSDLPVSLEILLLDRRGFRVVGEIERDPGATLPVPP